MLWDEPKIFFLERRYFFSIILSEFLKNRVALQLMLESMVSKFKAEKSKFIVKILSFYSVLRLIHDFHKLLTSHKRPAGIHDQIALEKTILYTVCDEVIAQTAQCSSFCCAVPL